MPVRAVRPAARVHCVSEPAMMIQPATSYTSSEQTSYVTNGAPSTREGLRAPLKPLSERPREARRPQLEVAGNILTLYDTSPPLMEAMLQDICAAKDRVWLESYIIADDNAGRAIADALIEKARAGLDVRVIYDTVGSFSTPGAFFSRMEEAGVRVHAYHSFREALRRWRFFQIMNRRDHRKITVVDDRIAYFGGMNIVDQSGITSPKDVDRRDLPASAGWRDVHVRMAGPQQSEVAAAFDRIWRRAHGDRRGRRPRASLARMLRDSRESITFFDLQPWLKDRRAARVFVPLIRRARRNITLSMAYFVPVGRVLRELVRARRRGVTVRIIVPGESDVPAVQWATSHFYAFLLRRGFRVYERNDFMLHSKVMVVDGDWSVVGSCNLDPRSLRMNLEFLAVIRSRRMAAALKGLCLQEMHGSRRVTMRDWTRRTLWERLRDRFAWSFRHWL